jgi:hypothetical protein
MPPLYAILKVDLPGCWGATFPLRFFIEMSIHAFDPVRIPFSSTLIGMEKAA